MAQKILAVDDEPDLLRLIERIISHKTSYEIVCTSNSLEVPELLGHYEFDLLITDLRMPGLDGMDILKLVKENSRWEEVVIVTAFGTYELVLEALNEGAFDFISKPFRKDQLLNAVESAMICQAMKKDSNIYQELIETTPYDSAEKKFRREYLKSMIQRFGTDESEIARASGLSKEQIIKEISLMI